MKIDKHIPRVSEVVDEDESMEETDPHTYYNRYSGYVFSFFSFNKLLDGSWETWGSDC